MAAQEIPEVQSGFYYGYIVVLAAFFIAVAVEGLLFTFGVFFKPLVAEFNWTRAVTSGAISLGSIIRIPTFMIAGKTTDRLGPRRVLSACGLFLGAGLVMMSYTGAVWHLYFSYGVVVAIGMGLYFVPVISTVPRWFVRKRALMMGIFGTGIGVGQLIAPPVSDWLISIHGWRKSCVIIGIVSMVVVVACAQFMRNPVGQTEKSKHNGGLTKAGGSGEDASDFSLREAVNTRWFWMVGVIYFSWVLCFSVVMVHSVIHAIGQGASAAEAAGVLALIGITTIIGRLIFGRMADVLGMKPAMMVSFSLMAVAFVLLLAGGEIWVIYLFAATYGISYGTPSVLQGPILAHMFGLTSLGAITGAVLTVGSSGFMIGPVLSGYIFDVSNSYHGAFLICIVLTLVCLISVAFLPLSHPDGERMKI